MQTKIQISKINAQGEEIESEVVPPKKEQLNKYFTDNAKLTTTKKQMLYKMTSNFTTVKVDHPIIFE
jgi:hypothetical protein